MANILLLGTPTNALSTGATIKGAPLTVLQVDDNFNNINAALSQNITINGSVVQLGGSVTVTANTSNALTAGTGITSGGTFNGSVARTFAIDTTVVATLSGTQTLTNKTLSGANNTISTTSALTAGSGLTSAGTFNGSADRTFAVDSTVVRTTGNQTLAGTKTFSSTIAGSINGNAATATKASTINNTRDSSSLSVWTGTQAQYDAIATKDATTLYFVSA